MDDAAGCTAFASASVSRVRMRIGKSNSSQGGRHVRGRVCRCVLSEPCDLRGRTDRDPCVCGLDAFCVGRPMSSGGRIDQRRMSVARDHFRELVLNFWSVWIKSVIFEDASDELGGARSSCNRSVDGWTMPQQDESTFDTMPCQVLLVSMDIGGWLKDGRPLLHWCVLTVVLQAGRTSHACA